MKTNRTFLTNAQQQNPFFTGFLHYSSNVARNICNIKGFRVDRTKSLSYNAFIIRYMSISYPHLYNRSVTKPENVIIL